MLAHTEDWGECIGANRWNSLISGEFDKAGSESGRLAELSSRLSVPSIWDPAARWPSLLPGVALHHSSSSPPTVMSQKPTGPQTSAVVKTAHARRTEAALGANITARYHWTRAPARCRRRQHRLSVCRSVCLSGPLRRRRFSPPTQVDAPKNS